MLTIFLHGWFERKIIGNVLQRPCLALIWLLTAIYDHWRPWSCLSLLLLLLPPLAGLQPLLLRYVACLLAFTRIFHLDHFLYKPCYHQARQLMLLHGSWRIAFLLMLEVRWPTRMHTLIIENVVVRRSTIVHVHCIYLLCASILHYL